MNKNDLYRAQLLWNHFQLNEPLREVDLIVCLGSIDTLPAEEAARLYLDGWSRLPYLLFSGKQGRFWDKIQTEYATEAEYLARAAVDMGIPEEQILLDKESTNTGESYKNIGRIIDELNLPVKSILSVHMPHAERRDKYTAKKVLPELDVIVTSPRVPLKTYHERGFSGKVDLRFNVATLIGDYQRCGYYAELGWMARQPDLFPDNMWTAYEELISGGYTEEMLRDSQGNVLRSRESKSY